MEVLWKSYGTPMEPRACKASALPEHPACSEGGAPALGGLGRAARWAPGPTVTDHGPRGVALVSVVTLLANLSGPATIPTSHE